MQHGRRAPPSSGSWQIQKPTLLPWYLLAAHSLQCKQKGLFDWAFIYRVAEELGPEIPCKNGQGVSDHRQHHVQGLTNIELIFLPPNTTAKMPACDQGKICSLKIQYRKRMVRQVIAWFDAGKPADESKITLLDALQALQDSWNDAEPGTIRACFKHCGFKVDGAAGDGTESERTTRLMRM